MPGTPREHCPTCGEGRSLLSIKAAAELADVNRKTIYRWIHAGLLDYLRLPSGAIRVFEESLLRVPRKTGRRGSRTAAAAADGRSRPSSLV
jgi:excisionase family DNA binding protein